MRALFVFFLLINTLSESDAFCASTPSSPSIPESTSARRGHEDSRRHVLTKLIGIAGASLLMPRTSRAEVDVTSVEMKEFVDPYGLFSISVPNGFYTLRRKAKGDLPDEKTGKGRRGSSIFTAGNMAKAEVVAVERYVYRDARNDLPNYT